MKRWAILASSAILAACQTTTQLSSTSGLKEYEREVTTRLQRTWIALAQERVDSLKVGQAHVTCKILLDGRVSDFKVLSNSGGESLAAVAKLTVERTTIPPIPRAALSELPHGYDPGDFTFTVYQRR